MWIPVYLSISVQLSNWKTNRKRFSFPRFLCDHTNSSFVKPKFAQLCVALLFVDFLSNCTRVCVCREEKLFHVEHNYFTLRSCFTGRTLTVSSTFTFLRCIFNVHEQTNAGLWHRQFNFFLS